MISRKTSVLLGRAQPAEQPLWLPPMLATLTDQRAFDDQWVHERKFDGVRCIAIKRGPAVELYSRSKRNMNSAYPELVDALAAQRIERMIVDGEIVALQGDVTSFSRLQSRMHVQDPRRARRSPVAVHLFLFDIMHIDGYDLTNLPLLDRKALLREHIVMRGPLRYSDHVRTFSRELLGQACARGWEGLIAKQVDSPYTPGRSRAWLKLKCTQTQAFIIGGYTDSTNARSAFGAVLVGQYHDQRLVYAGKVGSGFDEQTLALLGQAMRSIEQTDMPFEHVPRAVAAGAHWVEPILVAQVRFAEWTSDSHLRHPRFVALLHDVPPETVTRRSG